MATCFYIILKGSAETVSGPEADHASDRMPIA